MKLISQLIQLKYKLNKGISETKNERIRKKAYLRKHAVENR